ncbi:metal ABC transporter solute-binding protein, Zn/Mn family [Geomesophilobacter sediminis]|uniref:Zinc ABC transporter substrate-binding protein n=1 Tax=Geomesophilobacter sediminis TaxID=2798584 RepID=A0A8J7IP54_9BACT|nr:zinc ABC transporter substrate-binding protein [Geomesophilobacter sediminis]MBJ6724024.1 zinc ABC transporter substrate-binding protein [Geomesophilobacter sediminis]
MKRSFFLCLLLAAVIACVSCSREVAPKKPGKLAVVTTLFPLYDFARNVGGERAQVNLLVPPGVEPHSFEPKPGDAVKVAGADLFVYTSDQMEPWAPGFVKGIGSGAVTVVDASQGVPMIKSSEEEGAEPEGEGHHHHGGMDPHVWLDFANAQIMVDNIAAGMARQDPAGKEYYLANAKSYKEKLQDLDARYRQGLTGCAKRTLLHGGHYAFGYLARRYHLKYEAASAVNADAEPTPAKIAGLVQKMRAQGLHYVFTEELLSPRVSELIARETGAKVLLLHGAHNIGKDDFARGVTFLSLMEKNLQNLETGLECRKQ